MFFLYLSIALGLKVARFELRGIILSLLCEGLMRLERFLELDHLDLIGFPQSIDYLLQSMEEECNSVQE
jgi:hypothetical protein